MPRDRFCTALFELADLWTRTLQPLEYADFLRGLYANIARRSDADGKDYFWREVPHEVHFDPRYAEEEGEGEGGGEGGGEGDGAEAEESGADLPIVLQLPPSTRPRGRPRGAETKATTRRGAREPRASGEATSSARRPLKPLLAAPRPRTAPEPPPPHPRRRAPPEPGGAKPFVRPTKAPPAPPKRPELAYVGPAKPKPAVELREWDPYDEPRPRHLGSADEREPWKLGWTGMPDALGPDSGGYSEAQAESGDLTSQPPSRSKHAGWRSMHTGAQLRGSASQPSLSSLSTLLRPKCERDLFEGQLPLLRRDNWLAMKKLLQLDGGTGPELTAAWRETVSPAALIKAERIASAYGSVGRRAGSRQGSRRSPDRPKSEARARGTKKTAGGPGRWEEPRVQRPVEYSTVGGAGSGQFAQTQGRVQKTLGVVTLEFVGQL